MSDPILFWNQIALDANRVSHTDDSKEQNGPPLSSRALAIIHLAMYDAFAGIDKTADLPQYLDPKVEAPENSPEKLSLAVAAAAYTTLAEKILAARKDDPNAAQGTFRPEKRRGVHKVDPDNPGQGYHAPFYGEKSKCFALANRGALKLDAPPFENGFDPEYLTALRQVRGKGIKSESRGDLPANLDTAARTAEEETIGVFWSYDGTPGLGTPPRPYNQIIRKIAIAKGNTPAQNANLFALINVAIADAGILCWDEKYRHQFWRPAVAVREHDSSFGVLADGKTVPVKENLDTDADPFWLPAGAQSSNTANIGIQIGKGKNFTPNFPAYPSGHAAFGAAAFQMTRLFYGVEAGSRQADQLLDDLKEANGRPLYFVSDELNEKTQDNNGTVRPLHRRSFKDGLWGMILENAISRVFLGVHWIFDAFALKDNEPDFDRHIGGVGLGLKVAENIYKKGLKQSSADFRQTMYASTIDLKKLTKFGEILLNSRSPRVMEVTPTFYTEDGTAIQGEAILMQPLEVRFTPVKNLIPSRYQADQNWGGMSISYTGKSMEVAAQITLNGKDGGSADVLLSAQGKSDSDTQEAVWWQPKSGKAILALGNCSNETIQTTAQFSDGRTEEVEIESFATYYLEYKANTNEQQESDGGQSVKLITAGPTGSLKAIGFVTAGEKILAATIRFSDTKNASQPDLFATNFKVKNSKPHLLLKNTSAATVTAIPHFYPAKEVGEEFSLSEITLAPGEIRELNLKPLQKAAEERKDLRTVSIRIANNAAPGSLIASLVSHDKKSEISYDTPLRDPGTVEHSTGGYPWKLDDNHTTIISITNTGQQKARLSVLLNYDGGRYMFKFQYLEANQTTFFNLRQLRDEQTPDENGNVLPINATVGNLKWSIIQESENNTSLIGRALIVNHAKKTSNSLSCGLCCPYQGPQVIDAGPNFDLFAGTSGTASAMTGYWTDCYGYPDLDLGYHVPGPLTFYMYTSDSTIGTAYQDQSSPYTLNATGILAGSIYWFGQYYVTYYQSDETGCYDYSYYDQTGGDMNVSPVVESITNGIGSVGSNVQVSIDGNGFSANSIIQPINGITFTYPARGEYNITAVFHISATATPGNNEVRVIENGILSNSMNFFVQIPKKAIKIGDKGLTIVTNGDIEDYSGNVAVNAANVPQTNKCGAYRNFLYELQDQQDPSELLRLGSTDSLTVTELLTNFQQTGNVSPSVPNSSATNSLAQFTDAIAVYDSYPNCPGVFTFSLTQKFKVTIGSTDFQLTTQNTIAGSKDNSGNYALDSTNVTP